MSDIFVGSQDTNCQPVVQTCLSEVWQIDAWQKMYAYIDQIVAYHWFQAVLWCTTAALPVNKHIIK